jgi:hypothetical protein
MQFQLPQNLLKEVVAYDPVLKPVYAAMAGGNKKAGPTAPRLAAGVIDCLVPTDLIGASAQLNATTGLNQAEANGRFMHVDAEECRALIMYHKSQWLAWWFIKPEYIAKHPEVAEKHNYLYGFSVAFKNTPAAVEKNDAISITLGWTGPRQNDPLRLNDCAIRSEVKTGRSKFVLKTLRVTHQMVIDGMTNVPMRGELTQHGRTLMLKRNAMTTWLTAFQETIPVWENEHLFTRIREEGDIRKCVFGIDSVRDSRANLSFVELLIDNSVLRHGPNPKLEQVFQTPYFKKEANKAFDQTVKDYTNPETDSRGTVLTATKLFKHRVELIQSFLKLYDNASLDHCQQMWELATNVEDFRVPYRSGAREWLRDNMPVSSFLQIISKEIEDRLPSVKHRNWNTGTFAINLHNLNDSMSMLEQIHHHQHKDSYDGKLELARPNRWRLTEFHDYLVGECFKISTPNEVLPQDLFPKPVRVEKPGQKYSFFQPCDVHQLASWGKAVRNCVGSANNYRAGIKRKTHFIILVMLNGEPRYTVQARLNNGQLIIEQIADTCNKSLSPDQRTFYEWAFDRALQIRSAELAPIEETELELTSPDPC